MKRKLLYQSGFSAPPNAGTAFITENNHQQIMRMKSTCTSGFKLPHFIACFLVLICLSMVSKVQAQIINEFFIDSAAGGGGWYSATKTASGLSYTVNSTLTANANAWSGNNTYTTTGGASYIGTWNNMGVNNFGLTYTTSTAAGTTSTKTATVGQSTQAVWSGGIGTGGLQVASTSSYTNTASSYSIYASNVATASNFLILNNSSSASMLITPIITSGIATVTVYTALSLPTSAFGMSYVNGNTTVSSYWATASLTNTTSYASGSNVFTPGYATAAGSKFTNTAWSKLTFTIPSSIGSNAGKIQFSSITAKVYIDDIVITPSLANIVTGTAGTPTASSCVINGCILNNLSQTVVSASGVAWSTTSGAEALTTTANSKGYTTDGLVLSNGAFNSNISSGLPAGTLIYYKAYATNPAGTFFAEESSFTTLASVSSQPTSPSAVCTGSGTATFTASFNGSVTNYLWYEYNGTSATSLTNSAPYSGTTTATLTVTNATTVKNGLKYFCKATNAGGVVYTDSTATLTVNSTPSVTVPGSVTAVCQGSATASLAGGFSGSATSAVWSDGGAGGSFSNNGGSTPNTATYTPSASSSSPVTLTLTSAGGACTAATGTVSLTVYATSTVNAGGAVSTIAQGATTAALGGSFGGGATSAVWTDSLTGATAGIFYNNGGSTPGTVQYKASATAPSTVKLTLNTSGGHCGNVSASKNLSVSSKLTQTITFGSLGDVTYGVSTIDLSTLSTPGLSGNAVTFSIASQSPSGIASLSGTNNNLLTITGAGDISITANEAGDATYNAADPVTQSLHINKLGVSFSGTPIVTDHVYDRTTNAIITSGGLTGVLSSDLGHVAVTSGTFVSYNVANGITVTPILTGTAAANYSIAATLSGNITPASLTISSPAVTSKAYNQSNAATITGTLSGIYSPDVVNFTGAGTFASTDVANGISVTAACTLGGTNAGNYTLTQPTGLTGNITKANVTIQASAQSKVLGTTITNTTGVLGTTYSVASGIIYSGDDITVTLGYGGGDLSTATVAGSPYTITPTFGGASLGNYNITAANGVLTVTNTLVKWPLTSNNTPTVTNSSVLIAANEYLGGNLFSQGFSANGHELSDSSVANAKLWGSSYIDGQYVDFTITPTLNNSLTISGISLYSSEITGIPGTTGGSPKTQIRYAIDNSATASPGTVAVQFASGTSSFNASTAIPSVSATGTLSAVLNYGQYLHTRIYIGATSATTTKQDIILQNLTINGSVTAGPIITAQPSDITICKGGTIATPFSVIATGTGLTYQWYSNATNSNTGGTLITGATGSTYSPSTTNATTTYYYCIVANGAVTSTTNTALLTVDGYNINASASSVTQNTTVVYGVPAGGSYTWSIPGTQGTDYSITSGSTNSDTISITWLTIGSKSIGLTYTTAGSCSGSAPNITTSVTDYVSSANDVFQSKQTGNWSDINSWQSKPFGTSTWHNASIVPNNAATSITIANGNITLDVNDSANQLIINSGDTLFIPSGKILKVKHTTSPDLSISGTLVNAGTITLGTNTTASVNNGGTYQHAQNAGPILTATWNTGATCLVTGVTSTVPTALNQAFYNFTWNCSGQSKLITLGSTFTTVNGNFNVVNTNAPSDSLVLVSSSTTNTLAIGGDLIVGSKAILTPYAGSGTAKITISVSGNLDLSAGRIYSTTSSGASGSLIQLLGVGKVINMANGSSSSNFDKIDLRIGNGTAAASYTIAGNVNYNVNSSTARVLTVSALASLNLGGHTLTTNAALSCTGTLIGSASSNLVLNTTQASTLNFGTGATDSLLSSLTLSGSAAVTLNSGLGITKLLSLKNAAGSLNTANGHITLKSTSLANTAELDAVTAGFVMSGGNITVERYIPQGLWEYEDLGTSGVLPTAGTSIHDQWQEGGNTSNYGIYITGNTGNNTTNAAAGFDIAFNAKNASMWAYPSNQWVDVKNTYFTPLRATTGYRVFVRGDRNFTLYVPGVLQQAQGTMKSPATIRTTGSLVTGDVRYTTSATTINYGTAYAVNEPGITGGTANFNLISNPYACPISWSSILSHNGTGSIYNTYYYLVKTVGGYNTYATVNYYLGDITVSPSYATGNDTIQQGQAFWVMNTSPNPVFTIKETDKAVGTSHTGVFAAKQHNTLSVTLLSNNLPLDGTIAMFDNNFTASIGDEDSRKMMNGGENIFINTSNTDLSIAGLPVPTVKDVIALNLTNVKAGNEYTLNVDASKFSADGLTAYIKDAVTNTEVLATEGIKFTPTAAAATYTNRFSIVFKPATTPTTIITNTEAKGTVSVYPNPVTEKVFTLNMQNVAKGKYSVTILDNLGKEVMASILNHESSATNESIKMNNSLPSGMYRVVVKNSATGVVYENNIITK